MSSLKFSVYKLSRENTHPGNMCDIVFKKVKVVLGVLKQKQPSKGFFKKGFMRNFPEFTKKHLCRNIFFSKVKPCRSATSLKIESLKQVFSRENCWNTFFAENHWTTASDCRNINSNKGRIGKQNRKLLKRAVQVKEQVSETVVCRLQIRYS